MTRLFSTLILSSAVLALASCASVPSSDQLVAGIDQTKIAQAGTAKRVPTDPVCADFYKNVGEFQQKAQSSQGTKNFFSRLGLNVASAVLVGQVVPTGISNQVGRTAAYVAAGTATSQGSRIAMRELSSSNRADSKIIEVAGEIGCPVNIRP